LHLKSITLKGFKSFAQPTTLVLEPGITCVVGPNGSGKSNVVDALAWVMGEQGAKTLRGGKMEDVIFAGTATKGPLGRAEVQLTIDNSDGALPIEYSEVTISRVLFRNGTSEYAINGEQCRLLDVQELLSDTGLGREMHVIVGQGQLDTVLRATPIERRAFIEEAAGILKYRRRKEKTERKLEAMQVNLTRLNDLAGELRRQLKPLGRQAEVARQAQEIAGQARSAKSALLAFQIRELKSMLATASASESERRAESSYAEQQLAANRAAINELETQLVSPELDDLRKRLFDLESLEQRLRGSQNLASQRIALLSEQVAASRDSEASELEVQLQTAEQDLQALDSQLEVISQELRSAEEARQAASSDLSNFEADQLRQRSSLEEAEREIARLTSAKEVAQSKLEGAIAQLQRFTESLRDVTERVSTLSSEHQTLAAELESVSDNRQRSEYEQAQKSQSESLEQVEIARANLHTLERERDAVAAKHSALSLTLDQSDGSAEVRKAKLQGVKGLLADSVSIKAGFETAIAAALGTLADAVVVETRAQALAALDYLKREGLGRAEFLVSNGEVTSRNSAEIAGLTCADSVISAPESILDVLASIYIARNMGEASTALDSGKFSGKTIITKDGDLIASSLVRGGGSKQPSKLELVAERDSATNRLTELAREIQVQTDLVTELKSKSQTAEAATRDALSKLQQHDAELAARAERVGRLLAQVDAAKSEQSRIQRDTDLAQEAKSCAESELKEAEAALATLPPVPSVTENEAERSRLVSVLEGARQAELEIRVRSGALVERRSSSSSQVATLRGRLNEARAASERDAAAAFVRSSALEQARRVAASVPEVLQLVERLATGVRASVRELEAQRIQRTDRLTQLRSANAGLEARWNELNRSVHDYELQNHELRLNLANLNEKVRNDLALDPETLLSEEPEADKSREELEKALKQAELRLAQLGAFNPLALEEFSALEERHRYLNEQLEDLSKARADLIGIIKDLDEKMQHIFASAFEDTKAEFEKIFPILFPGGSGSISLTEPNDLLATGVEVSVKPVGKRIERMSLLSGGERSLAAVALLVAIFKARPSPFYVLDEVEAALDDANLGRLLNVIETLRKDSQLIIVTHQKRTMEIADALYGVSMRQDGMSAVVGQKLDKAS